MRIVVDEQRGAAYVELHELLPEDEDSQAITYTMEKHGVLLHWNGRGTLLGIEFPYAEFPVGLIDAELPTADLRMKRT